MLPEEWKHFRRVWATQIHGSFARCAISTQVSRSGGRWEENPQAVPYNLVGASCSLVPLCQFVIAASHTFLRKLAPPQFLLLLHALSKTYSCIGVIVCGQRRKLWRCICDDVEGWDRRFSSSVKVCGVSSWVYTHSDSWEWLSCILYFSIKFYSFLWRWRLWENLKHLKRNRGK